MADFQSITEISRQLQEGKVAAVDICRDLLDGARSSPFRAFSDILVSSALEEAQASDRRRRTGSSLGPLDGVPIAIKDIIDTTPAVCKAGLHHLSGYRPRKDAPVVQRLREAGATILGVTETDPGAFSTDTPQVVNPVAPDRTAGGSSGGSAAAVAAGLAFGALGTDTGGSIRIPSACCSIYGFKPTWGRVEALGVRPLARSLDHVGPMARNVEDLRILMSTIDRGLEWREETGPLRLGTCEDFYSDAVQGVQRVMSELADRLRDAGGCVVPVKLPLPDEVMEFHMINLSREAAAYHVAEFPDEWDSYPDIPRSTILFGNTVSNERYEKAEERRLACRLAVDAALEQVDALVLPSMPMDAPPRNAETIDLNGPKLPKLQATIRYTAIFNQTGHPVVSMPASLLPDGRAWSIQLVGRRGGDNRLLLQAKRLEEILAICIDYQRIIADQSIKGYSPLAVIS